MSHFVVQSATRTTAQDRPFRSGLAVGEERGADLDREGYVEDEFIVTGRAAVYGHDAGFVRVSSPEETRYVTRILIRRPRDMSEFNGTVLAESLHPAEDADSCWRSAHPWILRTRGAWLGATTTRRWTEAMSARINPRRYARLRIEGDAAHWGILSDTLTALRHGSFRDLPAERIERVILSGWSKNATYCRVFLMDGFHEETLGPDGRPAVDGYLIGISSGGFIDPGNDGGYMRLNPESPQLPDDDDRRTVGQKGVRVIELHSENEAETHGSVLRADSDDPSDPYRLYQVAGSGHATVRFSMRQGWPGDDCAHEHRARPEPEIAEQASDFPLEYIARAAYDHLDTWLRDGTPPPRAARMLFADHGPKASWECCRPLARDCHGNAIGGVRSTHVDVPTATYRPHSTSRSGRNPERAQIYPHMVPFGGEKLAALYDSPSEYASLVRQRADSLVGEGWLLQPEAELIVDAALRLGVDDFPRSRAVDSAEADA